MSDNFKYLGFKYLFFKKGVYIYDTNKVEISIFLELVNFKLTSVQDKQSRKGSGNYQIVRMHA